MKMLKQKNKLSNNKLIIVLHILAWVIIMLIPRYIINTYGDGNKHFLYHLYVNIAIYGMLFYLNYIWLVPKLFLKGQKTNYLIATSGLMFIVCIGMWYINEHLLFDHERAKEMAKLFNEINKEKEVLKPPIKQFKVVNYFYTSLLVIGFSLGLKLLEKVTHDEKKQKELEKEKLNSELAFLKNQISPHFFFNTLNNIYSLIGINIENAKESVLKLSKLMRYLLYESEKGKIKLSEEITFINNFIDLMKLRLNNKVKLTISIPTDYPNYTVPPLLFVPFIENAFKHGISYREPSFINIKMEISENQIIFQARNSIVNTNDEKPVKYSGIGLKNIKKRLDLLFPDSHNLKIIENKHEYSVVLILLLNLDNEND